MQNRTDRNGRRTSTGPDWVLWLLIAGTVLVAAVGLLVAYRVVHDARAQAALNCPPQDHAVYAPSIHQWICGASLNVGVKSR